MSFPRYPEYKDSGVEWLDELPAGWSEARVRWLATVFAGGTPDKRRLEFWNDGTIPWLNSGCVNQGYIVAPSAMITDEGFLSSSAKWVPRNSLVIALAGQGKTKGMVAQLGIEATCNQSMAAIVPGDQIDARYLYWWLVSNYQNIRNLAGGDLRDGLNLELLGSIGCPLPSKHEQLTIAAFLDHETARIDALVAEQQRLIGLLKEKRQAVISHAVTKGLNPDVPMKGSGVEWLGEVPAHWNIARIKHACLKVTDGAHISPETENGKFPFVSTRDISDGKIDLQNCLLTSANNYDYLVKTGCQPLPDDVLFSKDGTIGETAIVRQGREFVVASSLIILRATITVSPDFLALSLQSSNSLEQAECFVKGAALRRLSIQNILNLWLALPPLARLPLFAPDFGILCPILCHFPP